MKKTEQGIILIELMISLAIICSIITTSFALTKTMKQLLHKTNTINQAMVTAHTAFWLQDNALSISPLNLTTTHFLPEDTFYQVNFVPTTQMLSINVSWPKRPHEKRIVCSASFNNHQHCLTLPFVKTS